MIDDEALIRDLYEGFNRRDIPAVTAMLGEDVAWANGMDGGHEHGREAVRAYWTRQWAGIQPKVHPHRITRRDRDTLVVEVHQVVHDLQGKLLLDEDVRHVFRVQGGLVTRFDIEQAGGTILPRAWLIATVPLGLLPTMSLPATPGEPLAVFEPPIPMGEIPIHLAWHERHDHDVAVQHLRAEIRSLPLWTDPR